METMAADDTPHTLGRHPLCGCVCYTASYEGVGLGAVVSARRVAWSLGKCCCLGE